MDRQKMAREAFFNILIIVSIFPQLLYLLCLLKGLLKKCFLVF